MSRPCVGLCGKRIDYNGLWCCLQCSSDDPNVAMRKSHVYVALQSIPRDVSYFDPGCVPPAYYPSPIFPPL